MVDKSTHGLLVRKQIVCIIILGVHSANHCCVLLFHAHFQYDVKVEDSIRNPCMFMNVDNEYVVVMFCNIVLVLHNKYENNSNLNQTRLTDPQDRIRAPHIDVERKTTVDA